MTATSVPTCSWHADCSLIQREVDVLFTYGGRMCAEFGERCCARDFLLCAPANAHFRQNLAAGPHTKVIWVEIRGESAIWVRHLLPLFAAHHCHP
jgi:hypothetical protein